MLRAGALERIVQAGPPHASLCAIEPTGSREKRLHVRRAGANLKVRYDRSAQPMQIEIEYCGM